MASNRFRCPFPVLISIALLAVSFTGLEPIYSQTTPASAILGRAGWEALRSGRVEEAARTFREAIAADAHDASLFFGVGLAAHLLGQPKEARQALEQALHIDPGLTNAVLLLGEIAYHDGDIQAAIQIYEDGLARAPGTTRLQDTLARWRREASLHDRFDRRLSDHFTVLFEGPSEQQIAELALQILEAAYWRIGASLSSYPSDSMTVVLYSRDQFRDITRSPQWAAGMFDGQIRVPVRGALERRDEFQRVLTHEFTHALIWAVAPRGVPTWLNEGLAVVFEGENMNWADERLRETRQRLPLADLHGSFSGLTTTQAALAYAEGGLAAQALLDRVGGVGITHLLTDLSEGVDFTAAFERRALISYADFQREWASGGLSVP